MRHSAGLVCLVAFALGLSATLPAAQRTAESAITPAPHQRHERFMDQIRAANGDIGLVLIGDSITDGWSGKKDTYGVLAPWKPLNLGISGERTEQVLWRLENGELEGYKAKAVMIMIGTNNLGHFGDEQPEWTAAGVAKIVALVRAKQPQARILLLAIFPRGKAGDPIKARVDAANALISKLGDGKMVTFMDIGPRFLLPDGSLSKELMPDFLHPNAAGYKVWLDAVKPTLDDMMK